MKKIPFFLYGIDDTDVDLLKATLNSYTQTTEDIKPLSEVLEENFQEGYGVKSAISVNNHVSALLLSLKALNTNKGAKVICSINSHPFIPEAISYLDAEPVFVDIDTEYFTMLPEACEELIKKDSKIKTIIVSHIAGQLVDLEPFYKLKQEYGVKIIEDASYGVGLNDKDGKQVGTNPKTDACILTNFLASNTKVFNAGMIITNNEEIAQACKIYRYHSIINNTSNQGLSYDIMDVSLDHMMSEVSASLCLTLSKKLDERKNRRLEIVELYKEGLGDINSIQLPKVDINHIYTLFIVKIKNNRDRVAKELKKRGIETNLHFVPINFLSYYKNKYNLKVTQFPNSLQTYHEVLSLPIYSSLSDEDVGYIVENLREVLEEQ